MHDPRTDEQTALVEELYMAEPSVLEQISQWSWDRWASIVAIGGAGHAWLKHYYTKKIQQDFVIKRLDRIEKKQSIILSHLIRKGDLDPDALKHIIATNPDQGDTR